MKLALREHKGLLAVTLLFSIITSAASVFIALILQKVIDAAMLGDRAQFIQIVWISAGYLLLLSLLGYLYALCTKALIRNVTISLRGSVFRGVMQRNPETFASSNTADYLSALTNDTKLVEENYLSPLLLTIENAVVFAASLVVLLYISPMVTLILLGCMLLMFIVPSLFGKAMQSRQNAVSEQMSVFTSKLKDLLSGYEVIKSYAMGRHAENRFQTENRQAANSRFRADRLFALNESVSHTLAILTQFAVVFIAGYLILAGKLSAGSLVALVQLSGGFVGPVLIIMQNLPKLQGIKPVIKRMDELAGDAGAPNNSKKNKASKSSKITSSSAGILQPKFNDRLQAKGLRFGYSQDLPVIRGVHLTLRKGRKYALVGPSGCGKSTLVKLLTGYYEGYEGRIVYDGADLRDLDQELLRQMVSTIHQNVYMFDSDIRYNICLHEEYDEQELNRAVLTSGIHKFLSYLPNGLQSPAGENGSQLSGGQRQRIAVARALIRNKPILILDEGTSAIDRQTGYEIESKLLALPELTLITITHNMNDELLSQYDEIIYMEEGQIQEQGSFHDLIARGGPFSSFFTIKKEDVAAAG
ncbi:ABC transporter ATP-binding protein [Paenibacillus sp. CN-4]|uniref:ABC transporter ATP-binding protein n=1 Tax=Paenibacillus nanchangensis TaxID=3348343 RepID=UPI00397875B5